MADKVTVELSAEYVEHLELLKQIIPSSTGEEITDNSKMVEALIDSFMAFINEQAGAHEHAEEGKSEGGCGTGSCGCSH
jgi:hypothetical protein